MLGVSMDDSDRFREAILEAQIEASLGAHDIGSFEEVTDTVTGGYEARCKICAGTIWVGYNGLRYSLLEDTCRGEEGKDL